VEAEREAVRLVADPLQELKAGRGRVEHDRAGAPGYEDLLLPLRERDPRPAREVVGLHRGERRRELTLAAVDDDEVGDRGKALVVLPGGRHRLGAGEPAR